MLTYNIAPSQLSAVITADYPNKIHSFHFGLVPHWAKDKKVGFSMINAKAETILEKPSFMPLMTNNKRCLMLADGFYEWKMEKDGKQHYRFVLPERPLFAFADLYSR